MPFVEADFFLAIVKDTDWLKKNALAIYERYKDELWTDPFTIAEILLIAEEFGLDHEKIVMNIYRMAEVKGMDETIALRAAHYIKEKRITVFDALHAAYAEDDEVVSSDKIYDKLGFERIKLER